MREGAAEEPFIDEPLGRADESGVAVPAEVGTGVAVPEGVLTPSLLENMRERRSLTLLAVFSGGTFRLASDVGGVEVPLRGVAAPPWWSGEATPDLVTAEGAASWERTEEGLELLADVG